MVHGPTHPNKTGGNHAGLVRNAFGGERFFQFLELS